MATIQPTSFPAAKPGQAYTTPPNSQGYQQYPNQSPQAMDTTAGTPLNLSPASPHNAPDFPNLPLATRQLRPPKSPLYVPAALRPTERPHRSSPLTPPRSVHGSTDSLDNTEATRPISRRSTTDSKKKGKLSKVTEDDSLVPTQDLGEVTGLPTRQHWKPDVNAPICDAPTCQKHFGLFERRHHCRHCGNVFCNAHSPYQIPLDQDAEFHPKGDHCRVCGHCWDAYAKWAKERISRASALNSAEPATPNTAVISTGKGNGKSAEGVRGIASSLTRDWNWSTF